MIIQSISFSARASQAGPKIIFVKADWEEAVKFCRYYVGISNKQDPIYDYCISIPYVKESLLPLVEVIPLQMLAYHLALYNDADPNYPRNLAKSVTVK